MVTVSTVFGIYVAVSLLLVVTLLAIAFYLLRKRTGMPAYSYVCTSIKRFEIKTVHVGLMKIVLK